jgi:hypothetical protein
MTETCPFKLSQSLLRANNTSYEEESNMKKKERKNSINSSSPEVSFNNLNSEIKSIIENETDLSFTSNTNSEIDENKTNIDHLFDSKYWRASKETNSETDEPFSSYDSQNDKDTPSKKDKFIIVDKKNSPKPFHSKYAEVHELGGMSEGSNKQSTQSNEDEEARLDHLPNINLSYYESNNISPINSLNESDDKENKSDKIKINTTEDEKVLEGNKEKILNNNNNINNNVNNNMNNNKKVFINRYNNIQNIKYNNDSTEYTYPYEAMYKNNTIPFFQGVYLPQQLCSFIPNYNYSTLNKKNFILNNNNNFNKPENLHPTEKNEDYHLPIDNNNNGQNTQYTQTYMNNMNTYNKKMDMIDLPLVINQNNPQNNTINYRYPKFNFNMICCPQIQPTNIPIQKPVNDKMPNNTNFLPDINNKENAQNSNDKKTKSSINKTASNTNNNKSGNTNNSSNNSSSTNSNVCPLIEQNNNKTKINNKNFLNSKTNLKGEKQVLNLDDIVMGKDTRTTVMIRNIPIKYTDEILIEELIEFNGKYDCLYMPYDYEKNGNKGYAFINFVNPLHILYFYEKFNGKKWMHFESSKICELNCAHFQGINEIQKHAKNYKGQKKPSYYSRTESNESMIIPSKYLAKLKKRFPKMQYSENKIKKIIVVKSFE